MVPAFSPLPVGECGREPANPREGARSVYIAGCDPSPPATSPAEGPAVGAHLAETAVLSLPAAYRKSGWDTLMSNTADDGIK